MPATTVQSNLWGMTMQKKFRFAAALAVAGIALNVAGPARAQTYPSHAITIVLPVPPGGLTDAIARILGDHMRTSLGQPLIVESVPGAGGSIAVDRVTRAVADGYTLSIGSWLSHVGAGAIYPARYDVTKDLEPIARLADVPLIMTARKDFPAKDLKEVVAYLRANPDKVSFATAGPGSASHVIGVHFQRLTGTRFQFVPFRGGAPAIQSLVAGHVDLYFGDGGVSLPPIQGGLIKAYAVSSKTRWLGARDLPTMDEAGVPGLDLSFWHGLWAPKGTPQDIIAKLNLAVVAALADPAVRQRLADLGQELPPREQQTPEALRAYHMAEIEKWWPIIKAANIKGE